MTMQHRIERLRSGAPPATFAVLLVASLMLRCAKTDPGTSLIGFQPGPVARGGSTGTARDASSGTGGISLGAGAGGLGGVAPSLPCTPATADVDCPLPASTCAGDRELAYYTNPVCVDGNCQWTPQTTPCNQGCVDGACEPAFTAVGAGNVDSGVECSGDASVCKLPPSVCTDDSHLLYFVNPACVAGICRTEARTLDCGPGLCANAGCKLMVTAH